MAGDTGALSPAREERSARDLKEERAVLESVKVRPGGLLRVTRTLTQTGSHSREIGNILMERDN